MPVRARLRQSATWPFARQLALLVAFVSLPLLAIVAWDAWQRYEDEREEAGLTVQHLAADVALRARGMTDQAQAMAAAVARRPRVIALDPSNCDPLIGDLHSILDVAYNVSVLDAAARFVCSAQPLPDPPPQIQRRGAFDRALQGTASLGEPVIGGLDGRWIVAAAHPVAAGDGRVIGVVAVTIDLDKFAAQIRAPASLPDALAMIVTEEGFVVARSADGDAWTGKRVEHPALAHTGAGGQVAPTVAVGLDGVERIYGVAAINAQGWQAIAGIPAAPLLAQAYERARVDAAMLLAVVLVLAAGALLAARRLLTPVRNMAERLSGVMESAMDAIVTMDAAGEVVDFNPAAQRMFGYARAEAVGRPLAELIVPPAQREAHRRGLARHVATGESRIIGQHVELDAMRADGTLFPVELTITRTGPPDTPLFTGFIRDITERRQAVAALRQSEERYRAIVDAQPDLLFELTAEGVHVGFFAAEPGQLYSDPSEIIGRSVEALLPGEVAALYRRHIDRSLRTEAMEEFEYELPFPAGARQFNCRMVPCSPGQVLAVVRDITERKRMEAELRANLRQLRSLSRRLIDAQESERRAINRELHDRVGQQLALLNLRLERLRQGVAGAETAALARDLEDAQSLTQSSIRTVRDVMAELRPPVLDDFGLAAALRDHLESFGPRTGLAIELELPEGKQRDPIDVETAYFRIAQEALSNAAKHAQATRVRVRLQRAGRRLRMEIEDDGQGFDPESTGPMRRSWGLGTMRERAEAIDASFHVESKPGRGTRVIVERGGNGPS